VLNEISEEESSTKAQKYLLGNPTDDRVFGIQWKVNTDQFTFDVNILDKLFTRRGILSTVASLYDSLGFVVLGLLEAKRILQVLCKQNLGLNEPIAKVELKCWKDLLESLPALNSIKVRTVDALKHQISKESFRCKPIILQVLLHAAMTPVFQSINQEYLFTAHRAEDT